MRYVKTVLVFCLLALTLAGCAASTMGTGSTIGSGSAMGSGSGIGSGYFPADGNYGPATSVPQTYMTTNGDRVGHYAPYYYPDGTSGGDRN